MHPQHNKCKSFPCFPVSADVLLPPTSELIIVIFDSDCHYLASMAIGENENCYAGHKILAKTM